MELVTGAMGSLLPKLGELLKKEYGLQKGMKRKIETLSRELTVVYAVLRRIGDVPPDQLDELVKLWASEVREASYDMEDIIDTFLVRVKDPNVPTEPHKLRRLRKTVGKLFKKSKARRKISTLIQDMNMKLEEVAARRGRYTLDNIVAKPVAENAIDPRILNLYKSAMELVGIEGPRDELIKRLSLGDGDVDLSSTTKMQILSIVGSGGLGKTTLAKAVYDHLKLHFECQAFVPVGQNPDAKKIFRDILTALDEEKHTHRKLEGLDENQLMGKLNKFVKQKRCLIVIDDIWDMETWKLVRCALQESNCGSRLVITTRISEVATCAGEAYKMQPLSYDNSKQLLYARIVGGEGKYFDSPSAEACEKILKKCGGVPLAIITIASLLASKPGEDWSEVYNSIGFGHQGNDDVDTTRKILSFSYYDLPSHLKACLLYLSIFPEDHIIQKNSLIWMWMAEGFISEEQAAAAGIGLFELGERFFNELINRNMIQAQETGYGGYVNACSVHDMVLDLILKLSSEQNFVTIWNGGERQKPQGNIARRLVVHGFDEGAVGCQELNVDKLANIAVEKVRSVFASECDFYALLCSGLPFVRVVETVACHRSEIGRQGVLGRLGSLLHLRYLRVESGWSDAKLLREVRYLRFLQTLDLQRRSIQELPKELELLTKLVCLRLGEIEDDVSAGLICKLTSLQELWVEKFERRRCAMQFVKELRLLRELRVLNTTIRISWESIEISVESIWSALLESLGHLHNIRELAIRGKSVLGDWQCHSTGPLTSRHLRFQSLAGFVFNGVPAWINSLLTPNLSYLHVCVEAMREQDMEALAKLPELNCLSLQVCQPRVIVIKIRADEGVVYFRKLRVLNIQGIIWFDVHVRGSECNSSRVASSNNNTTTIMPSLESLEFEVHVRSLKDENPHLGFDKMLRFQDLGTSSLQRVTVEVNCNSAGPQAVEEAEAALKHVAAVHLKHPTLVSCRSNEGGMVSHYIEAANQMCSAPELIIKAWKLTDIVGSEDIQILRMPDLEASSSKVMCLLYTNSGFALLALSSNAVHRMWKWEHSGKPSKSVPTVLWKSENGILVPNGTSDGNGDPKEATACTALCKNDWYLISASGGNLSIFDTQTFEVITTTMVPPHDKVITTTMIPPHDVTFLASYPRNFNIIAIGREDSSIQIYNVCTNEARFVLRGHHKKITGLAFSPVLLVSSGADAQLCVWNIDGWVCEKEKSIYIKHPYNTSGALVGDTMVQFHDDETHLLVVHESQLAIYDCGLECLCLWFPRDALSTPISSAVYSLGCLLVYAGFRDGAIGIFEAESLTLKCRIAPSAYIPTSISSSGQTVYPTAVATHPWKPNQIAVGMSDGSVLVLEPLGTDDIQVASNASTDTPLQIRVRGYAFEKGRQHLMPIGRLLPNGDVCSVYRLSRKVVIKFV